MIVIVRTDLHRRLYMIDQSVNYAVQNFRMKTKSYTSYNMSANHFHDAYELYYLNQGTRKYFIHDKTYTIDSGSMVLIKPYELHKTLETGQSHSRLLINFKPDYLPFQGFDELIDSTYGKKPIIKLNHDMKIHIEQIFAKMMQEANDKNMGHQAYIQSNFCRLLIDLGRYIAEQEQLSDQHDANDKIYGIIDYLKAHYKDKITLQDLSDQFYISRYYLSHSFKKATGLTIMTYVQNLRIIEAQKQLRETNNKITDIAQSVGFPNVSAFGKTFKSITEMSPNQYRKSVKV